MFSEKQGVEESYPCSTLTKLPTASTQVQQIKACHLEMASKVALEKSWHTTQIQRHRPPEPPPKDVVFLLLSLPCLVTAHTDLNTPLNRKLHGKLPKFSLNQMFPWKKNGYIWYTYAYHWSVTHVFFFRKNPESSNPITGHIPSIKLHLILSSWGKGLENSETATPTVVSSEIATRSAKKKQQNNGRTQKFAASIIALAIDVDFWWFKEKHNCNCSNTMNV